VQLLYKNLFWFIVCLKEIVLIQGQSIMANQAIISKPVLNLIVEKELVLDLGRKNNFLTGCIKI
jgi:hypothetical protein